MYNKTFGINLYVVISHIKVQYFGILEPLQLMHCIAYSSQGMCISDNVLVNISITYDEPHGTLLLRYYKYGRTKLRLLDGS